MNSSSLVKQQTLWPYTGAATYTGTPGQDNARGPPPIMRHPGHPRKRTLPLAGAATNAGTSVQDDAGHPPSMCHPGTREHHLSNLTHWARDTAGGCLPIVWVRGPAGVGKSAVARSFTERISQSGAVGAAFFFSRHNHQDLPSYFVPSIAYQLAVRIPSFRDCFNKNAWDDSALASKSVAHQFQELIISPFWELKQRGTNITKTVVLVDGLDECEGDDAQCQIVAMVAKSVRDRSTPLRWIFFSRPEPHITSIFESQGIKDVCSQVTLPVSRDADKDIRLYLLNAFEAIRKQRGIRDYPWPSDKVIHKLVSMSAGLFIYAATVVKLFERSKEHESTGWLKAVLGLPENRLPSSPELPLSELDQFYISIMQHIPPSTLPNTQRLLLAAITFQENASEVLNNLLGYSLPSFYHALYRLHSVLSLQESDSDPPTLFFYHVSFIEFLLDPGRSGKYCINIPTFFTALLKRCLRIINGAQRNDGSDNASPNIHLSHDVGSISPVDLKWLVYKTAVKNLFKLWMLADLDRDSNEQLESLDFSKFFMFRDAHESGIWQVFEPDLIRQVSQKSNRLLHYYHSGFFSFKVRVPTSTNDSDSVTFPTYVVGTGKRRAFLVPRKLFVEKTQYVLVPKP